MEAFFEAVSRSEESDAPPRFTSSKVQVPLVPAFLDIALPDRATDAFSREILVARSLERTEATMRMTRAR